MTLITITTGLLLPGIVCTLTTTNFAIDTTFSTAAAGLAVPYRPVQVNDFCNYQVDDKLLPCILATWYLQCDPNGVYVPKQCASGLRFSLEAQVCVVFDDCIYQSATISIQVPNNRYLLPLISATSQVPLNASVPNYVSTAGSGSLESTQPLISTESGIKAPELSNTAAPTAMSRLKFPSSTSVFSSRDRASSPSMNSSVTPATVSSSTISSCSTSLPAPTCTTGIKTLSTLSYSYYSPASNMNVKMFTSPSPSSLAITNPYIRGKSLPSSSCSSSTINTRISFHQNSTAFSSYFTSKMSDKQSSTKAVMTLTSSETSLTKDPPGYKSPEHVKHYNRLAALAALILPFIDCYPPGMTHRTSKFLHSLAQSWHINELGVKKWLYEPAQRISVDFPNAIFSPNQAQTSILEEEIGSLSNDFTKDSTILTAQLLAELRNINPRSGSRTFPWGLRDCQTFNPFAFPISKVSEPPTLLPIPRVGRTRLHMCQIFLQACQLTHHVAAQYQALNGRLYARLSGNIVVFEGLTNAMMRQKLEKAKEMMVQKKPGWTQEVVMPNNLRARLELTYSGIRELEKLEVRVRAKIKEMRRSGVRLVPKPATDGFANVPADGPAIVSRMLDHRW